MAETTTKERPILFSVPMVRAILDGRKTQTRRMIKPQPPEDHPYPQECMGDGFWWNDGEEDRDDLSFWPAYDTPLRCPYGKVGERLWVREAWAYFGGDEYLYQRDREAVMWRATWEEDSRKPMWNVANKPLGDVKWRPSIHMPRWASRLTLEITGVRVERLQSISAADILAEGVVLRSHEDKFYGKCPISAFDNACYPDLISLWRAGWQKINGNDSWIANPWVWALSFRHV